MISQQDGELPLTCRVLLERPTSFSFATHEALLTLWLRALGVDARSPRTRFEVWRTHLSSWEASSINDSVTVYGWEAKLVIRARGVLNLSGFQQRICLPNAEPGYMVVDLVGPGVQASSSPTQVSAAPSSPDPQSTAPPALFCVNGEGIERAWQDVPISPASTHSSMPDLDPPSGGDDNVAGPSHSARMPSPEPVPAPTSPSAQPEDTRLGSSSVVPRQVQPPPHILRRPRAYDGGQRRRGRVFRHRPGRRTASSHTTVVIDLTGDTDAEDADAEGEDCDFVDLTTD